MTFDGKFRGIKGYNFNYFEESETGNSDDENPRETVAPGIESRSYKRCIMITLVVVGVASIVAALLGTRNISSMGTTEVEGEGVNSSQIFLADGPFKTSIELLSTDVVLGYRDEADLGESIEKAAYVYIGLVYERDKNKSQLQDHDIFDAYTEDIESFLVTGTTVYSSSVSAIDSIDGNDMQETEVKISSFDFNNFNFRSHDLKEGDILASDDEYFFSSFGKYLVVWSKSTGDVIKKVETPSIPAPTETMDQREGFISESVVTAEPNIQSIIAHQGRLLLVVGGYSDYDSSHILADYLGLRVLMYNISQLTDHSIKNITANTGCLGSTSITGNLISVQLVGEKVHIVTVSAIETYFNLMQPIARSSFDAELSDDDYKTQVTKIANNVVAGFRDALIEDLKDGMGNLPASVRINLWSENMLSYSLEDYILREGMLASLILVNSIDMASLSQDCDENLAVSRSTTFLPSYNVHVCSSSEKTFVAVDSYQFDTGESAGAQKSTTFISFGNDGSSVNAQAIGTVPGSLIAFHAEGRTVQVATKSSHFTNGAFTDGSEFWINVLGVSQNKQNQYDMQQLGQVQVSDLADIAMVARFFNNVMYVATDSGLFFVFDTSKSTDPKLIVRHYLPDFRGSLYTLEEDSTLLLGLEHSKTGEIVLSLFDVSYASSPFVLHQHTIERRTNSQVQSDAFWDFKAASFSDGFFVLPIDNGADEYEGAHGFMVFSVGRIEGISEMTECMVTYKIPAWYNPINSYNNSYNEEPKPFVMTNDYGPNDFRRRRAVGSPPSSSGHRFLDETERQLDCNCDNVHMTLPRRAQILDGNIITISDDTIVLTDLQSCSPIWNITIEANNTMLSCCERF